MSNAKVGEIKQSPKKEEDLYLLMCEYFSYNNNGYFTYKKIPKFVDPCKIGKEVGGLSKKGYKTIRFFGQHYMTHRLIWFYHYKHFPKNQIDHINRIKTDNRIENLRECTNAENAQNRTKIKGAYCNRIGITFNKRSSKYVATICINKVKKHLGTFTHEQDAIIARQKAEERYHWFSPANAHKNKSEINPIEMIDLFKSETIQKKLREDNKTAYNGVNYDKKTKKYVARFTVLGNRVYLGCFLTAELANDALLKFKDNLQK